MGRSKESGRFVRDDADGANPACDRQGHSRFRVQSIGTRTRADKATVHRYRCVSPSGAAHEFSVCFTEDLPPSFAKAKCQAHPGSKVVRKGKGRKGGTEHQRYLCTPRAGMGAPHRFVMDLPRRAVKQETDWANAESVRNPHKGETEAARGYTATTEMVAEGLQMLSLGKSYSAVGKWAHSQRPTPPPSKATVARRAAKAAETAAAITEGTGSKSAARVRAKNYWATGADWVECFAPVLMNAWRAELAAEPVGTLPRVLVLDDKPVYGASTPAGEARGGMEFSVLFAIEYFQPDPARMEYDYRVRAIRAYPHHKASAYELLVYECGGVPDVIVSDSSSSIITAVRELRKVKPDLAWVPSSFHIRKNLRKALARMTKPATHTLNPGTLVKELETFACLRSPDAWEKWWDDLATRMDADGVPASRRPSHWHRLYYEKVYDGLVYAEAFPVVPRGNGTVENAIAGHVEPFFMSRAAQFSNIERLNRAADLLTLQVNGWMDDRKKLIRLLREDAEKTGSGYAPPARTVTDHNGYNSLRDEGIITATLAAARTEHAPAKPRRRKAEP